MYMTDAPSESQYPAPDQIGFLDQRKKESTLDHIDRLSYDTQLTPPVDKEKWMTGLRTKLEEYRERSPSPQSVDAYCIVILEQMLLPMPRRIKGGEVLRVLGREPSKNGNEDMWNFALAMSRIMCYCLHGHVGGKPLPGLTIEETIARPSSGKRAQVPSATQESEPQRNAVHAQRGNSKRWLMALGIALAPAAVETMAKMTIDRSPIATLVRQQMRVILPYETVRVMGTPVTFGPGTSAEQCLNRGIEFLDNHIRIDGKKNHLPSRISAIKVSLGSNDVIRIFVYYEDATNRPQTSIYYSE